jgi:hypothetical protein
MLPSYCRNCCGAPRRRPPPPAIGSPNAGLTKIYNRFHDPDERSNAIGELRRLHDAMDRAVLDAYGWTDIRPTCEFELEWQDDEAENGRRRKKPWRYRWPEAMRDEVLARLLALNARRAEEERQAEKERRALGL